MFQFKGILKVKGDVQQVSEKFKKRDLVITDNSSQYPQHCLFQLTQERTDLLNDVNEGDILTAHFNLRGREWTSPQNEVKYFNSLEVWRIEKESNVAAVPQNIPSASEVSSDEEDDLPF